MKEHASYGERGRDVGQRRKCGLRNGLWRALVVHEVVALRDGERADRAIELREHDDLTKGRINRDAGGASADVPLRTLSLRRRARKAVERHDAVDAEARDEERSRLRIDRHRAREKAFAPGLPTLSPANVATAGVEARRDGLGR